MTPGPPASLDSCPSISQKTLHRAMQHKKHTCLNPCPLPGAKSSHSNRQDISTPSWVSNLWIGWRKWHLSHFAPLSPNRHQVEEEEDNNTSVPSWTEIPRHTDLTSSTSLNPYLGKTQKPFVPFHLDFRDSLTNKPLGKEEVLQLGILSHFFLVCSAWEKTNLANTI